jgi:hypothetical protein
MDSKPRGVTVEVEGDGEGIVNELQLVITVREDPPSVQPSGRPLNARPQDAVVSVETTFVGWQFHPHPFSLPPSKGKRPRPCRRDIQREAVETAVTTLVALESAQRNSIAGKQREEAPELLTEVKIGRKPVAEARETDTLTLIYLAVTEEADRRADAQRRDHEAAVEAAVATLVAEETDNRKAVTDAQATSFDLIAKPSQCQHHATHTNTI